MHQRRRILVNAGITMIVAVCLLMAGGRMAYAEDKVDGASIDSLIAATYDVISGPAGAPRDWDRFRALFVDGARLIPRNAQAETGVVVLSPEDYVERAGASFAEQGFFEREIARRTERFGDIVHVFSAYEGRRSPEAEPFLRGVNSFQLVRHEGRWRIVTIFWMAENEDTPLVLDGTWERR